MITKTPKLSTRMRSSKIQTIFNRFPRLRAVNCSSSSPTAPTPLKQIKVNMPRLPWRIRLSQFMIMKTLWSFQQNKRWVSSIPLSKRWISNRLKLLDSWIRSNNNLSSTSSSNLSNTSNTKPIRIGLQIVLPKLLILSSQAKNPKRSVKRRRISRLPHLHVPAKRKKSNHLHLHREWSLRIPNQSASLQNPRNKHNLNSNSKT